MERIMTTTSPLEAGRLFNQGKTGLSIRDTKTGRFVKWDLAKEFNFGVNGQSPLTYDHLKKELTLRTEWQGIEEVRKFGGVPLFLTSEGIICDGKIPMNDYLPLWREIIKRDYPTVFEAYR